MVILITLLPFAGGRLDTEIRLLGMTSCVAVSRGEGREDRMILQRVQEEGGKTRGRISGVG